MRDTINTIDEYIAGQPAEIQPVLQKIRQTIREAAPDAKEKISWRMPTFWQGENLIHFAVFKKHIGIYPGGEASAVFADRLTGFKTSKGAIQFPLGKPVDYKLIEDITRWRVAAAGSGDKSVQLLCDPDVEPNSEIIAEGLGAAYKTYTKFIKELAERYGITLMDWRYYNDGKAWLSKGEYKWTTARGANKVKPVFWFSIWNGFFKTSFYFPASVQDELLKLPISRETKEIIKNAKPMGKSMRFFPVVLDIKSDGQLSDVYEIAQFRKTV